MEQIRFIIQVFIIYVSEPASVRHEMSVLLAHGLSEQHDVVHAGRRQPGRPGGGHVIHVLPKFEQVPSASCCHGLAPFVSGVPPQRSCGARE